MNFISPIARTSIASVAFAAVAAGASATVIAQWWPRPSLSRTLRERTRGGSDSRFYAHLFTRLADCRSNLGFLSLFNRPAIRAGISLSGAWVIGPSADVDSVRPYVDAFGLGAVRTQAIALTALSSVAVLGAARTPFIIVFDNLGRVRLVADVPASPRAYVALASMLTTLATSDK
jgi:hypothetical protein